MGQLDGFCIAESVASPAEGGKVIQRIDVILRPMVVITGRRICYKGSRTIPPWRGLG